MSASIRVTVAVPTYNRERHIGPCLRAIGQNAYDNFELIVVDQSSSDATGRVVADHVHRQPELRYIHVDRVGVSYARNVALNEASGSLILFTDDDVRVSPGWIQAYVDCYTALRKRGITPGVMSGPLRAVDLAPRPAWWPDEFAYCLCELNVGSVRQEYPPGMLPLGANFGFPVDILRAVGGFDERFGMGGDLTSRIPLVGEDSLTGLRIARLGYPLYFEPSAGALHVNEKERLTLQFYFKRLFIQGYSAALWEYVLDRPLRGCVARSSGKDLLRSIRSVLRIVMGIPLREETDRARDAMLEAGWAAVSLGRVYGAVRFLSGTHRLLASNEWD
ncbi:MAG: glycosyltransferase [Desulfomonile tiedjei]|nr:glycosyltransferase [Desulfomonile tiedjei]